MNSKSRVKGYTLVELMVSMAIMLILIAPLTIMFNTWYGNFYTDNSTVVTQQKAKEIMNNILQDLREASTSKTSVKDKDTLFINENLVYKYDSSEKILYKNQENVINDQTIDMTEFTLEQVNDAQYDGEVINIKFKLKSDYDIEVELSNVFRKKLNI